MYSLRRHTIETALDSAALVVNVAALIVSCVKGATGSAACAGAMTALLTLFLVLDIQRALCGEVQL
jgi:hypothetical protein